MLNMGRDFRKCLRESVEIFDMKKNALPLLLVGRLACWYFRNRHIMLTLAVNVRIDVIDTCACADASGECD